MYAAVMSVHSYWGTSERRRKKKKQSQPRSFLGCKKGLRNNKVLCTSSAPKKLLLFLQQNKGNIPSWMNMPVAFELCQVVLQNSLSLHCWSWCNRAVTKAFSSSGKTSIIWPSQGSCIMLMRDVGASSFFLFSTALTEPWIMVFECLSCRRLLFSWQSVANHLQRKR